MGHHGSKENDAASSGHFQKQKSSSGLGGSKRKRDKKSLSSAVSVSSNDSSLIPAFVIESENDVDCRGLTPWSSRENLLHFNSPGQSEIDSGGSGDLYMAQFDYSTQASNQLSFQKGDLFRVLGFNDTGEWCEAQLVSSPRLNGGNPGDGGFQQLLGWVPFNHIAAANSRHSHSWYHGPLSKIEAEHVLLSGVTGSFLVRESEGSSGTYTISLRHDTRVYHYRINFNQNAAMYFISEEAQFDTLEKLIHHHSKHTAGLRSLLRYPAAKRKHAPPPVWVTPQHPQDATVPNCDPASLNDQWELDRSEIQIKEKLGSGQYGDVYRAIWTRFQGGVTVAVKTLREGTCSMDEFMQEAQIMKTLRHPNLVQLLGVCTREIPIYIITEFMPRGNLLSYVRSQESLHGHETQTTLMFMSSQIAAAMAYLESMNYIHRDLAARNCLVGEGDVVKVADFGLSRLIGDAEECYQAREGAKFPIKWTAPESLAYNKFSTKSDVWAFGVLLWEIASGGMSPYPGIELCSLYEYLQQGSRLNQPPECPKALYALMKRCWQWLPRDRPSFAEINKQLASLLDEVRQELDGSQGVPQSPEKLLDNFTVTTKGAISSMEISSGAVSDDSFEGGISCGSRTPDLDSPEGTLDTGTRRSTSGAGAGNDSDSGIGGPYVQGAPSGTPDSDTDSNLKLRNALFCKRNAPAPPMRTSSFQIKESPSFATGITAENNLRTLANEGDNISETGSSPLVTRNLVMKSKLATGPISPSSESLSTFKRPSNNEELTQSCNVESNTPSISANEVRSMKTMSVYHHNQSSDSEEDVIDPNLVWKPSGVLLKSSSNSDLNNTNEYGMKCKPTPNPRVFSSRENVLNSSGNASTFGAGQSQGNSSTFSTGQNAPASSTFSTFGNSINAPNVAKTNTPSIPPNKPLTVKLPASQHGYTCSEIVPPSKTPISTFTKSPAGISNAASANTEALWKASIPEPPKVDSSNNAGVAPVVSPTKFSPTSKEVPLPAAKPVPPPPLDRSCSKISTLNQSVPEVAQNTVKSSPKLKHKPNLMSGSSKASQPKPVEEPPKPVPQPVANPTSPPPTAVKPSHLKGKSKANVPNLNDDLIPPPPRNFVEKPLPPKQPTNEKCTESLIKPSAFIKAVKSQEGGSNFGSTGAANTSKHQIKHGHSKSSIESGSVTTSTKETTKSKSQTSKKGGSTAATPQTPENEKSGVPIAEVLTASLDTVSEIKSGVALRQSVRRPQISTLSATETEIFADVDLDTLLNISSDIDANLKLASTWEGQLGSDELSTLCTKLQRFHECCKNYSMVDLKVFSRRAFTQQVTTLEEEIEILRKSAKLAEASKAIASLTTILSEINSILNRKENKS